MPRRGELFVHETIGRLGAKLQRLVAKLQRPEASSEAAEA
jgi:uncharacterized small protein (DUF1192 family)